MRDRWLAALEWLPWSRTNRNARARQSVQEALDFTIVITTCNRPQMLPRALGSALNQSHDRFEIVVVDDASDSPVVIDVPHDGRITLARSRRRLGFAGAINLGASLARGRWLAFLDDDDEYRPDLLQRMHTRLKAEPDRQFSWCSTVFVLYDEAGKPIRETVRQFREIYDNEEDLLCTIVSVGSGYGFAIDKHLFHQLGGFDTQNYWAIADTEFFYRLIAAGHRPAVVKEPVMRVHKHGGPRMTDPGSYRNRALQCELLRTQYSELLREFPRLGEAIGNSIDQLTTLARAYEGLAG